MSEVESSPVTQPTPDLGTDKFDIDGNKLQIVLNCSELEHVPWAIRDKALNFSKAARSHLPCLG